MPGSFKDKVVIVTGGSQGVGAAIVSMLIGLDARVASLDIRNTTAVISDSKIEIECDVSSEAAVNSAIEQVIAKWQTLDVLINCAAVVDNLQRVSDVSNEMWSRCIGINLNGPFYTMRGVIPHFLAKSGPEKGAIVNIGSGAGLRGGDAGAAYTASKHGLVGLTRSTAWLYAKDGVRCNLIIPGYVATEIVANSGAHFKEEDQNRVSPVHNLIPAMVSPSEVAAAAVFLAGASGVNGAELSVDHGWRAA